MTTLNLTQETGTMNTATESKYVTVGETALGYVDIPEDWVEDRSTQCDPAEAGIMREWHDPEHKQGIVLCCEKRNDVGVAESDSIANYRNETRRRLSIAPCEYLNPEVGDAGIIAGHEAFCVSWNTPAKYTARGVDETTKVFCFVDSSCVHYIHIISSTGDFSTLLKVVATFHF